MEMKPVGLVLVNSRQARWSSIKCIFCYTFSLMALVFLLSTTWLGTALIEGLHQTGYEVGRITHKSMALLVFWPLLDALGTYA